MQKCLKLVFYMTLTGCLLIMFLSFFGVGEGLALTQDYGRGSVETRYTLGMGHPNALQCMVWALTVLALYLYGEKWKWYGYVAALAVNTGFFFLTDSKTSLAAAVFAVGFTWIICKCKGEKIIKLCGIGSILVTVGSIILSTVVACKAHYVYEYDWGIDKSKTAYAYKVLDNILTGRMRSLCDNERWEGTISTWKLFAEPANNYYFDMGWIRLFYWYGIIPGLIVVAVILIWMIQCCRRKENMVLMIIVSIAVYTVFEAHMVSAYIGRNYLLFILGASWCQLLKYGDRKES